MNEMKQIKQPTESHSEFIIENLLDSYEKLYL